MKTGKSKATWDVSSTEIFLEQCIEQIYKKERQGLVFTKQGWKNILSGFNEKAEKSYDKKQLKNRLDSLKKEWRAWDNLFSKETGVTIDYTSNMVIAEDEWWKRKIKENSAYGKYRYNGMKFARELQILFKDVTTSGDKMFTPSSTKRMSPGDDKDDLYRQAIDLEEDSGDSEEEFQGANTGDSLRVPTELEGINLTTDTQPSTPSGLGSTAKRKKGEGLDASKKKKMSSSKQIADAINVIAIAYKDRADALKKISNNDVPVSDIVAELLTIPEIADDREFRLRCYNMMMHQMCREMFVALKGDKDGLIDWLRHHAYKTPSWQEPPKH